MSKRDYKKKNPHNLGDQEEVKEKKGGALNNMAQGRAFDPPKDSNYEQLCEQWRHTPEMFGD